MDGSDSDVQYSHSLTTVSTAWNGFNDPESGIEKYTVRVQRKPYDSNTFGTVLIDNSVTATNYFGNHFSFTNGDEIVVEVTAINGAGLSTSVSSDGYTIDLTAPEVTVLQDGPDSALDLEYSSSSTAYSVNWAAFDDQSGLSSIEIALSHLSGGKKTRVFPDSLSLEPTKVLDDTLLTSYTIEGLELVHGYKYVAVLTFTNGAGLKSSFETNGAIVDLEVPVVQSVSIQGDTYLQDEESSDVLMLGDNQQVEVSWEGSDDGSGITEFSVAVVAANDDTVLLPGYVTFGQVGSGRISGLDMIAGDETNGPFYRVKVIATDNAGHESLPHYSETFW